MQITTFPFIIAKQLQYICMAKLSGQQELVCFTPEIVNELLPAPKTTQSPHQGHSSHQQEVLPDFFK